jgi:hypothetical protein
MTDTLSAPSTGVKKPKEEKHEAISDAVNAIASITNAATKSTPLLGIAKAIGGYVAKIAGSAGSFKSLAADPLANPIKLAALLDAATEKEWRGWEPATIRDFCELKTYEVLQLDKLLAIQVALTNKDVFTTWPLFVACCSAFNHRRANFEWLDKPSYLEAAWACYVLRALAPTAAFGPGVIRFLTALMIEDGLVYFPWTGEGVVLSPANEYCRGLCDCGQLAHEVHTIWDRGIFKDLAPDEHPIDETDALHVQLARLMAGDSYIRANVGKKD